MLTGRWRAADQARRETRLVRRRRPGSKHERSLRKGHGPRSGPRRAINRPCCSLPMRSIASAPWALLPVSAIPQQHKARLCRIFFFLTRYERLPLAVPVANPVKCRGSGELPKQGRRSEGLTPRANRQPEQLRSRAALLGRAGRVGSSKAHHHTALAWHPWSLAMAAASRLGGEPLCAGDAWPIALGARRAHRGMSGRSKVSRPEGGSSSAASVSFPPASCCPRPSRLCGTGPSSCRVAL